MFYWISSPLAPLHLVLFHSTSPPPFILVSFFDNIFNIFSRSHHSLVFNRVAVHSNACPWLGGHTRQVFSTVLQHHQVQMRLIFFLFFSFRGDRAGASLQTWARFRSWRRRARRKQALVKILPPLSATLPPAFSRYLCSRSSRVSTELSTQYTASVVLWYWRYKVKVMRICTFLQIYQIAVW